MAYHTYSYGFTGSSITFTAPTTGTYDITAYGAQGGSGADGTLGGQGAAIGGDFQLTAGEKLTIVVGGMGAAGGKFAYDGNSYGNGGGGGGGTFVTSNGGATALVIAGGGGGAGGYASRPGIGTYAGAAGGGGVTSGNGSNGGGSRYVGAGGVNGGGGAGSGYSAQPIPQHDLAGGGGGFTSAGSHGGGGGIYNGAGGLAKGGSGGLGSVLGELKGGPGGFGGGGGGAYGGGGGGGFSGGGGGGYFASLPLGGGGGGGGASIDTGTPVLAAAGVHSGNGLVNIQLVCFLRGTQILTENGEVPIEALAVGDRVVTRFGGLRPIEWIGRQSFDGRFLGQDRAPVCFHAGSLGENTPTRDLYVSPPHAMVVDDRLVRAEQLINGATITQRATRGLVEFFHLDLGVHDCVVANGAWSESYAERDNRAFFHNHAEFAAAFPEHLAEFQPFCLPGAEADDLAAIHARLAACEQQECFTQDPDLHLLADGARLEANRIDERTWNFEVPAGVRRLRLVSRASIPAALGTNADYRRLGVAIEEICCSSGARTMSLRGDDPAFEIGVHAPEAEGEKRWRWTRGDCLLPEILLAAGRQHLGQTARLVVTGFCMPRYLLAPSAPELYDAPALPLAG